MSGTDSQSIDLNNNNDDNALDQMRKVSVKSDEDLNESDDSSSSSDLMYDPLKIPLQGDLQKDLYDSHVHIIDSPETFNKISRLKIAGLFSMTTGPHDWDMGEKVLQYASSSLKIIPCFGVHPWQAYRYTDQKFLPKLEALLQKYPNAVVGEIGLDKFPKNTEKSPFKDQIPLFVAQLELAAKYNRMASIHIVRCQGEMYKIIKKLGQEDKLPPVIVFHAFSGPSEMVRAFTCLKTKCQFFFSFSTAINTSEKSNETVKSVPDHQLLIESDYDCVTVVESTIVDTLEKYSKAKQIPKKDVLALLKKNQARWLSLLPK